MNETRCHQLINQAISLFALDLSNMIVLTEAATGYYMLTPLIAALGGAERVYALTRDSAFGGAVDVTEATTSLARRWGVNDRVEVLTDRNDRRIGNADIITNLGFVRPLDAAFLQRLKKTAVIPLMWETWEYRPEDLDLTQCRRLGICVLGTNEHHPDLQIFGYIGGLALKLLFESGIEVFRSNLLIIGSGEFGEEVLRSVRAAGARAILISPLDATAFAPTIKQEIPKSDAVIVVEHHERKMLIGSGGEIKPEELHSLNPGITVVHICGGVERETLSTLGMPCWPARFAPAGYMSVGTDYLGPRPLIDLHTAGLKVGEQMANARKGGLAARAAEFAVLGQSSLAHGFSNYHG